MPPKINIWNNAMNGMPPKYNYWINADGIDGQKNGSNR
jgi:hypothetical protein